METKVKQILDLISETSTSVEVVDGDATIRSGAGDDLISSGGGDDTLDGGGGDDVLAGGPGADTFILRADGGEDRVSDFERGLDHLAPEDFAFADLDVNGDGLLNADDIGRVTSSAESGDEMQIDLAGIGGGGNVTLLGVTELSADDFMLLA